MRILIIEDDTLVADGLKEGLSRSGFTVDVLHDAESVEHLLGIGESFALAIVDLGLPGLDGLSLIERLRRQKHTLPILILTARDALDDCVKGLEAGADDYMTKPCRLPELVARVRALIRRSNAVASSILQCGQLELDTASHTARVSAEPLDLTGREWAILEVLLLQHPRVVAKEKLVQSLAGWERDITPNAIEVHISRLRAKLERSDVGIRTVRGIGYRLDGPQAA